MIGLLGGLVGLILGSLRMPALLRWVGETPQRAVGTNVTVGVFVGVAGSLAHLPNAAPDLDLIARRRRRVDPRRAARLAPDGAAVGGGADQGDRRRAAGGRGGLHRPGPNLTGVDLQEETADVLGHLIRFNTVNPPGNERECQEWLKAYLEEAGFECELAGTSDERPNLVARLRGEVGRPGARLPLARRHRARVARGLVARPVVGRAARRLRVGARRARHEVADRRRGRRRRRAGARGLAAAARRAEDHLGRRRGGRRARRRAVADPGAPGPRALRHAAQRGRRAASMPYDGRRLYGVCCAEKGTFRFAVRASGRAATRRCPRSPTTRCSSCSRTSSGSARRRSPTTSPTRRARSCRRSGSTPPTPTARSATMRGIDERLAAMIEPTFGVTFAPTIIEASSQDQRRSPPARSSRSTAACPPGMGAEETMARVREALGDTDGDRGRVRSRR